MKAWLTHQLLKVVGRSHPEEVTQALKTAVAHGLSGSNSSMQEFHRCVAALEDEVHDTQALFQRCLREADGEKFSYRDAERYSGFFVEKDRRLRGCKEALARALENL
jgi:hypothetical protein